MITLLELKRAEDAGETCAMEDSSQSILCIFKPLHKGSHSFDPMSEGESE